MLTPVEGKAQERPSSRTQSRIERMQAVLVRIRKTVQRDMEGKLTALYYHVYNNEHLTATYYQLKNKAAVGVDVEAWQHCGQELETNFKDLSGRLGRGVYRSAPVRRV